MSKKYEIRGTILGLEKLYEQRQAIEKEFSAQVKVIDERIAFIKKQCKHPVTDYEPDASGNNDSTTTCAICDTVLN